MDEVQFSLFDDPVPQVAPPPAVAAKPTPPAAVVKPTPVVTKPAPEPNREFWAIYQYGRPVGASPTDAMLARHGFHSVDKRAWSGAFRVAVISNLKLLPDVVAVVGPKVARELQVIASIGPTWGNIPAEFSGDKWEDKGRLEKNGVRLDSLIELDSPEAQTQALSTPSLADAKATSRKLSEAAELKPREPEFL